MYRTLGETLSKQSESAAPLLFLSMIYAAKHFVAVKRAGFEGSKRTLGNNLFNAILNNKSGVIISKHTFDEVWSLVKTADKKVHLDVPEMLEELRQLPKEADFTEGVYPFILMAGERRMYNANQIYRTPAWRKVDPKGTMRMHPEDAAELGITNGAEVVCQSEVGQIQVFVELDKTVRRKMVTLPNGYGFKYQNGEPNGPELNQLTPSHHCDPLSKTPFHKYLPVNIVASALVEPV